MQNLFENVHTVREEKATWSGLVNVGNSYSFNNTTTSKCSFPFYYRIIIHGDKTHALIFIVGTNNFIEYLQRYQILIFIYYKFYFIIFIITQY